MNCVHMHLEQGLPVESLATGFAVEWLVLIGRVVGLDVRPQISAVSQSLAANVAELAALGCVDSILLMGKKIELVTNIGVSNERSFT